MSHTDNRLAQAQQRLFKLVRNGQTKSERVLGVVEEIIGCSKSLTARYNKIKVTKLLQDNSQSKGIDVSKLIKALSILEKYGKNLIRPDPPPQWKVVRLSNAVFHTQVDIIIGSRELLRKMGYTEKVHDGLAFPVSSLFPERNEVSLVTSEIILLKYELAMFQRNHHPFPSDFHLYFSQNPSGNSPVLPSNPTTSFHRNTQSKPLLGKTSVSSMDHLCVVCGLKPAEFFCDICKTQHCASCDRIWHSSRDRVKHLRRTVYSNESSANQSLIDSPLPLLPNSDTVLSPNVLTLSPPQIENIKPKATSENLNWENRISEMQNKLQSIIDFKHQQMQLKKFCEEIDEQINKYEETLKRFDHSSALSKELLNRCSFLSDKKDMLERLFSNETWNTGEDNYSIQKTTNLPIFVSTESIPVFDSPYSHQEVFHNPFVHDPYSIEQKTSIFSPDIQRNSTVEEIPLSWKPVYPPAIQDSSKFTSASQGSRTYIERSNLFTSEPSSKNISEYNVSNISGSEVTLQKNFQSPTLSPPADKPFTVSVVETKIPSVFNGNHDVESFNSIASQNSCVASKTCVEKQIQSSGNSSFTPRESTIPQSNRWTASPISIEKIKQQLKREDFRIECMKTVDQLRDADLHGFSPKHVQIAIKNMQDNDSVVKWLNENWNAKIQTLVHKYPCVSPSEISTVFYESTGDQPSAEVKLQAKHKLNLQTISQPHLYDNNTAINYLAKVDGDCNKVLIDMQCRMLQNFRDRLKEPKKKDLLVNDFLSLQDRKHMQDALIATLSIKDEVVLDMMCIIMLETFENANDFIPASDLSQALKEYDIKDILEAAYSFPDNINGALKYLCNKCSLCLELFPQNKVECMTTCGDNGCTYCQECLANYLRIKIKERHIRDLVCPVCSLPDIDDIEEMATNHFNYLDVIIKRRLDDQTHAIFQKKLRDHALMKMPNFRWCFHCENGFLYEQEENNLKMVCPACHKATCYSCKKPWEDQHQGLSCQEFLEWKQLNDADYQAEGLAAHLRENGIDCPACKFKYALAKGGCMHFKCLMCSYQFCSGCKRPFKQGQVCNVLSDCSKKGLHAHHPRDCLFYLRDLETERLQKILSDAQIQFGTESKHDHKFCQVPEQKETSIGLVETKLVDDICGREVHPGNADLCTLHYKEYLVNLINNNHLDPAFVFTNDELKLCIMRTEKPVYEKLPQQTEEQYRTDLLNAVRELSLTDEKRSFNEQQPRHIALPVTENTNNEI